jgi:subtilisin family serine protease
MRVAVVDSGIAGGHPHVGKVAPGISLLADAANTADRIGHGTAVAAAIREKAPDAELVPVKVFDRRLTTDARTLADAVRWAASNDCQLINLSLGTSNPEHADALAEAVAFAAGCGALVVAAFESGGTRWLPGSLPGVVGVVGEAEMDRAIVTATRTDTGAFVFHASIYPRPIPGVPRERNLSGISFAVANVTGTLARLVATGAPLTLDALSALLISD